VASRDELSAGAAPASKRLFINRHKGCRMHIQGPLPFRKRQIAPAHAALFLLQCSVLVLSAVSGLSADMTYRVRFPGLWEGHARLILVTSAFVTCPNGQVNPH
jgi:hypothetical protein